MIQEDVCSRLDVLANDARAIEDFEGSGAALDDKIRLAIEQWLQPQLFARGYDFRQHRTRWEPVKAFVTTGGTWADVTDAAAGEASGITLRTVLATPSTDALYLAMDRPFQGVFASLVDSVNAVGITSSLTYWNGQWASFPSSLSDGTVVSNAPFARAGRIAWPTPTNWVRRDVNGEGPYYWMRLQVNSLPSAACVVEQLLPIVRSRLAQPTALKALALTYREGAGGSRGDWLAKADAFETAAAAQLELVAGAIADEFDVDDDGAVEATEVNSVTQSAWTWERG